MKRKIVFLMLLLLVAGCGAEWFPEPAATSSAPPNVASVDVGGLVTSMRLGPGDYKVRTVKATFATYTSLSAPHMTPVQLEIYTDAGTGLQLGRLLRAEQKTVLVREILEMVE